MKYSCGHVPSSSLLSAHNCSPSRIASWKCVSLDTMPCATEHFLSCYYLHVHNQEPWVLLCQHFGVGKPVNFLRECACSFHAGGCARLGMRILAKNTAPKCSPHDGLLLHQIQQLFPCIAVFCSAVLCQFSLFSLRRMHTGGLIHQPSEELCSN